MSCKDLKDLVACPRCLETKQPVCWLCRQFGDQIGIPQGLAVEYTLSGIVLTEPDWQPYREQIMEMAKRWL